jgi:hypothetical protein
MPKGHVQDTQKNAGGVNTNSHRGAYAPPLLQLRCYASLIVTPAKAGV